MVEGGQGMRDGMGAAESADAQAGQGCGCAGGACAVPPADAGASRGDRLRLTQLSSKAG